MCCLAICQMGLNTPLDICYSKTVAGVSGISPWWLKKPISIITSYSSKFHKNSALQISCSEVNILTVKLFTIAPTIRMYLKGYKYSFYDDIDSNRIDSWNFSRFWLAILSPIHSLMKYRTSTQSLYNFCCFSSISSEIAANTNIHDNKVTRLRD